MNKEAYKSLEIKAEEVRKKYSNPDRDNNHNGEDFAIDEIIPMTDNTAVVIYMKSSGKKGAFFFYRLKEKYWAYFVPKDDHILGMMNFNYYKLQVENHNRSFN